ncbi:MAG: hypothetical protein MCS20_00965 [Candidatus Phytoplasma mali]|nr:hypothetical protein [Candidatus Phytoplasma australiense]MCG7201972.1 hypothetical protein [Candidatus Phytoplasma mali]
MPSLLAKRKILFLLERGCYDFCYIYIYIYIYIFGFFKCLDVVWFLVFLFFFGRICVKFFRSRF